MLQNIINKSLISQQAANNSASLIFSNLPNQAKVLLIQFVNAKCTAAFSSPLLQWSTNGGSSFITTGYQSGAMASQYDTNGLANQSSTSGFVLGPYSGNTNGVMSGFQYLYNFNDSTNFPTGEGVGNVYDATNMHRGVMTSGLPGTMSVNALRVLFASGNITSGTFQIYLVL